MTRPKAKWHNKSISVTAGITTLWSVAIEDVEKGTRLRITVPAKTGRNPGDPDVPQTWNLSDAETVNANGLPLTRKAALTGLLVATAPCGALIGKVGGSSADMPDAQFEFAKEIQVFAVGSHCTVTVAEPGGPLYLTMNDQPGRFDLHSGTLEVTIEEM